MHVTCRFLQDALNAAAVAAAAATATPAILTWSFIEDASHEYLELVGYSCIPNLRNT